MVDFWFNHFNVFAEQGRGAVDDHRLRARRHPPPRLGRFRDLLRATARHPAMLFYLDNWLSVRAGLRARAARPGAGRRRARPQRELRPRAAGAAHARRGRRLHPGGRARGGAGASPAGPSTGRARHGRSSSGPARTTPATSACWGRRSPRAAASRTASACSTCWPATRPPRASSPASWSRRFVERRAAARAGGAAWPPTFRRTGGDIRQVLGAIVAVAGVLVGRGTAPRSRSRSELVASAARAVGASRRRIDAPRSPGRPWPGRRARSARRSTRPRRRPGTRRGRGLGERRRAARPHELRARPGPGPRSRRAGAGRQPRSPVPMAGAPQRCWTGCSRLCSSGQATAATRAVLAAPARRAARSRARRRTTAGPPTRDVGEAGRAGARLAGVPAAMSGMHWATPAARRCSCRGAPAPRSPAAAAPRFLLRAAGASRARAGKVLVGVFQRGAVDGLGMVVPLRRQRVLHVARPSIAHRRPARGSPSAPSTSTGSSAFTRRWRRCCPSGSEGRSRSCTPAARPTPRARTSTPRTTWSRHARREEHTGRLARRAASAPRGASAAVAVPRGGARPDAAAQPARRRGRAGHAPRRRVRRAGRRRPSGGLDARRGFEALYERGVRDLLHGTGRETFDAVRMLKRAGASGAWRRPTAPTIRAAGSARASARSPSSSAPTWASRSPSRTWAAGTPTPPRAPSGASSRNRLARARPAGSPPSPGTSGTGWAR